MNKVGRKKKFETAELLEIIKKYIDDNQYITKLKYVDLVNYSKKFLGYEKIYSQDFMRNGEIKEIIKKFNSKILSAENNSSVNFVDIDVNSIIDNNDANMQKTILRLYKDNYNKAFKELNRLKEQEVFMLKEIKNKEKLIKELISENKIMKKEILQFKENSRYTEKVIKEKRAINSVEYLYKKGIITELNKKDLVDLLRNIFNLNVLDSDNLNIEDFVGMIEQENKKRCYKEKKDKKNKVIYIPEIF